MGMLLDAFFFANFLQIFPLPLYPLPPPGRRGGGVWVGVGGGWCVLR